MFYMLTHDPKILYSPNGTAADDIIKKVGAFQMSLFLQQQLLTWYVYDKDHMSALQIKNISESYPYK